MKWTFLKSEIVEMGMVCPAHPPKKKAAGIGDPTHQCKKF